MMVGEFSVQLFLCQFITAEKIVCDPLLLIEIEEMRAIIKQSAPTSEIEDCTALDEEEVCILKK